jgi:uncharacterized membrane protein
VTGVENRLEIHKHPGDVPGLQGGRARPGERPELWQVNWSPSARLLAGAAGGTLLAGGLRRGGLAGLALGAVGAGLLARALTNLPVRRLAGTQAGRRGVDLQKTITIAAPVEEVFAFWSKYENFPHFLAHVREVRDLGNGRSHWVVAGPGGTPTEWNAVVTSYVPNQIIAWRTEPDSVVQHAGIVHFEPTEDGGTRIHMRLSYNPPAGAIGHGLAWLLGADPKHQLDEDMVRMKAFLETGRPARDAAQPMSATAAPRA